MTTTDENLISENSEENSKQDTTNTIPQTNPQTSEPEIKKEEAVKPNAKEEIDIPIKFKNKDGSTNLNALVKSYKELEPLVNEKANWTKEKETLLKEKEDLTSELSTVKTKNNPLKDDFLIFAKLYEKNLEKSSNKTQAKNLIEELTKTPNEDTLKSLEKLFPTEVIKDVSIKSEYAKNFILEQHKMEIQKEETKKVENYLKDVVEKNFEELKNPVTAGLFNEVFQLLGADLDSEWFFSKLKELKNSFIEEYQKEQSFNREKESAVSTASKLAPKNNTKNTTSLLERNALELSPQELDRMLDEFYAK